MKIQSLISRTKTARYKSYDGLYGQLLSNCPALFGSLFFIIFISILITLQFPFQWKTAFVHPFHKGGKKNCIENYRPVSLLSKISLIFERLLFEFNHRNVRHLLHHKQFGFQSRKTPITQLIDYIDTIHRKLSFCGGSENVI